MSGGSLAEIAEIGWRSSKRRNDALSACRRAMALPCCRSHAPLLEFFRGYKEGTFNEHQPHAPP